MINANNLFFVNTRFLKMTGKILFLLLLPWIFNSSQTRDYVKVVRLIQHDTNIMTTSRILEIKPYQKELITIADQFIKEHNKEIPVSPDDLVLDRIICDSPTQRQVSSRSAYAMEKTWHLFYVQLSRGYKIESAFLRMSIKGDRVTGYKNHTFRDVKFNNDIKIKRDMAFEYAKQHVAAGKRCVAASTTLVLLPRIRKGEDIFRLTYKFDLIVNNGESYWSCFIDTITGRKLQQVDKTAYNILKGKTEGKIYPTNPHDDPDQVIKALKRQRVTVTEKYGTTYSTYTDDNGYYQFNHVGSPFSLSYEMTNDHIVVTRESDTEADTPYTYGDIKFFKIAEVPYQDLIMPANLYMVKDWDWLSNQPFGLAEENRAARNAFYHGNIIFDYFTAGGSFDIPGQYFPHEQEDPENFVFSPYPVQIHTMHTSGFCSISNACANETRGLIFKKAQPLEKEDNYVFGSDIIYHEYSHLIFNALYNGDYTEFYIGDEQTKFITALNEAIADYFACSITNDSQFGEWVNYTEAFTPMRDIKNNKTYPADWQDTTMHIAGMVISGALWDMREKLGAPLTDSLVIRALKMNPVTLSELLQYIVELDDDDNTIENGTPHLMDICEAFYCNHGIFHPYCLGNTNEPIIVITEPAPLHLQAFGKEKDEIIIKGYMSPGYNNEILTYKIGYANIETPDLRMDSDITNYNTPPTQGITELGKWDIKAMPMGTYLLRITLEDTANNSATTECMVYINRELHPGWPILGFSAPTSILAFDIDPDYSNKEIIFNGYPSDYIYYFPKEVTYAFHEDGNLTDGWPKGTELETASMEYGVAIGKLEGPGDEPKVVIPDYLNQFYIATNTKYYNYFNEENNNSHHYNKIDQQPVLADLDGNGDLEIIYYVKNTDNETMLEVRNHDFTSLQASETTPAFPQILDERGVCLAADSLILDSVNLSNIFLLTEAKLDVLNNGGESVHDSFPFNGYKIYGDYNHKMVVGNTDNSTDNSKEIFIAVQNPFTGSQYPRIIGIYHNQKWDDFFHWKSSLEESGQPSNAFDTGLALGQLDTDSDIELLVLRSSFSDGGGESKLYIYDHDGEYKSIDLQEDIKVAWQAKPLLADLDGDSLSEIIFAGRDGRIYAVNTNGEMIDGWPKILYGEPNNTPTLADIDNNGTLELIASTEKGIFIIDLPVPYNEETLYWPMEYHDIHRSRSY